MMPGPRRPRCAFCIHSEGPCVDLIGPTRQDPPHVSATKAHTAGQVGSWYPPRQHHPSKAQGLKNYCRIRWVREVTFKRLTKCHSQEEEQTFSCWTTMCVLSWELSVPMWLIAECYSQYVDFLHSFCVAIWECRVTDLWHWNMTCCLDSCWVRHSWVTSDCAQPLSLWWAQQRCCISWGSKSLPWHSIAFF